MLINWCSLAGGMFKLFMYRFDWDVIHDSWKHSLLVGAARLLGIDWSTKVDDLIRLKCCDKALAWVPLVVATYIKTTLWIIYLRESIRLVILTWHILVLVVLSWVVIWLVQGLCLVASVIVYFWNVLRFDYSDVGLWWWIRDLLETFICSLKLFLRILVNYCGSDCRPQVHLSTTKLRFIEILPLLLRLIASSKDEIDGLASFL